MAVERRDDEPSARVGPSRTLMGDIGSRVAVITGGTRGLGAAISTRLAAEGVTVVAGYRADDVSARRFAAEIAAPGGITTHQVDVGDPRMCRQFISEVITVHGRIDYLINNAGNLSEHKLDDLTPEHWDDSLRINLSAAFHLAQAAIVPMRQARFGRIVNVGSVTAVMGSPFQVDYAAAKAGLVGLTRSLARAVARAGITVNCVLPGGFTTELLSELTLTDSEAIEHMVPIGRFGKPRELAHVVASLVHDDAAYVTGAVIPVDGGLGMGH
jgi:NAD(P)-dependent dehydrogenase (short-subunit alcohol dehydrogenase family)